MRTRIALALAATAAASFTMASPASAISQCSGTYATNCYTWVCNRSQCLEVRCAVWVDVVAGTQSGCFG
jgi:hypothetical protein